MKIFEKLIDLMKRKNGTQEAGLTFTFVITRLWDGKSGHHLDINGFPAKYLSVNLPLNKPVQFELRPKGRMK